MQRLEEVAGWYITDSGIENLLKGPQLTEPKEKLRRRADNNKYHRSVYTLYLLGTLDCPCSTIKSVVNIEGISLEEVKWCTLV